ncbi:hypothetical protein Tco_0715055 [Tanacetum coccineum]
MAPKIRSTLVIDKYSGGSGGDQGVVSGSQQGGNNRGNSVGRMTRIEFLRFNGDDVRDWVFRCEQYFILDGIPDEQKNVYKDAIIQRFGTVFDDPMSKLKNVKYETNAKD